MALRSCVVCGVLDADPRLGRFCGERCERAAADIRRILDGLRIREFASLADVMRMVPHKRADIDTDLEREGQFDFGQRRRAIQLIESLPWADAEDELGCFEGALFQAVEATATDFRLWRNELEDRFGVGLLVGEDDVELMSVEERWAYIASLLRIALDSYGVQTNRAGELPTGLQEEPDSLAALLRGLLDILYMPVLDNEPDEARTADDG